MKSEAAASDDMRYWLKLEGLTYALQTLDDYAEKARQCGLAGVETEDASAWYRRQVEREYRLLKGELYPRMIELIGQQDADHFVENWRAMEVVCQKGEMRQGYFRGYRPAAHSH